MKLFQTKHLKERNDYIMAHQIRDGGHYNKNGSWIANKKLDRNVPCPCGSGKKYKNCCGKLVTEETVND